MKEALFYKKLKNKRVQCQLCPHFCMINENNTGRCRVRKNISGKLISLVYSRPCSMALDPIEKKPLCHFYPGSITFSLATPGCNLRCLNCQNFEISQTGEVSGQEISPENILVVALKSGSKIISFTYSEPTIFYEYMLNIAKLARKEKVKCVMVSNGFINPRPLRGILRYLDAFNIDLKSIEDKFYREICGARLQPVLETLKIIYKSKKHLEITNLLIPGKNDSSKDIEKLVRWVKKNLSEEVPIHFSAYFPCYKLNIRATPRETVIRAAGIARKIGMKNVHVGNI